MKKALIITYYWPPSGGAGVQRWLKFVKYLPEYGVQPYIVTVDPSKASYPVTDRSLEADIPVNVRIHRTDTSEPFNLYKGLFRKKEIPYAGFANEKKVSFTQKLARFIRGNLFIPDARVGWNKYAFRQSCSIIESEKIDVVITTSPPHSTQLVGLRLKERYNLPWIADLRDPWTDIYYYSQMSHTRMAKNIDASYERRVLENAGKVITVSGQIKETFASKSKLVNPGKIHVIPNGFDEDDFKNVQPQAQDVFTVTYTGTIAESYEFTNFIEAFSLLVKNNAGVKMRLRFVGTLPGLWREKLQQAVGDVLEVTGYVSHGQSVKYLLESSALLLIIPQVHDNKGILTGKLFEYLAARKPLIGIGPCDGEAAGIIDECKAGKMFDYKDTLQLSSYLGQLLQAWKEKRNIDLQGEEYRRFSRRELTSRLAGIINEL
jgi:glycosyltransferase involved in cell wall biosynthesis